MRKHIDPLFSQKDNPIDATMPQEDVANVGWWGTREVVRRGDLWVCWSARLIKTTYSHGPSGEVGL